MDVTEKYIEMCKASLPELGKYIPRDSEGCIPGTQDCGIDNDSGKLVPLFRQDQLQEMLSRPLVRTLVKHFEIFSNGCEYLEGFTWAEKAKYIDSLTSMEQLWLAFVMKEKHGKTWDGNEWVAT